MPTSAPIAIRLAALDRLLAAAECRIAPDALAAATESARQVHQRVLLSPDHVVAALAGATGSGKSSLFNSLIRFPLSPVGAIRPTTRTGLAYVWHPEHAPGAAALLDRIGVDEGRRALRSSLLDGGSRQMEPELAPLILIDLPDHDSAIRAHREETDRAAATADLLIFVTDPQKYADASWHERYLRTLTHHQDTLTVVLNKIDVLTPDDARACVEDCARLLREAGLGDVPLIATSTRTGAGLAELRSLIAERVRRKQASLLRSGADLDRCGAALTDALSMGANANACAGAGRGAGVSAELEAESLDRGTGPNHRPEPGPAILTQADREAVCRRLGEGTGAQALADLIDATYRRRASAVTGWPVRHGFLALRARVHARANGADPAVGPALYRPWTALVGAEPAAPPVQRPDVEAAVDHAIAAAAAALPPIWAGELRRVGDACVGDLTQTLDATLAGTEVGPRLVPRWWTAAQVLHWMLLTAALIGLSGVIAYTLFGSDSPSLNLPDTTPLPFPAVISLTALGAGVVLDVACRFAAARAAAALRMQVGVRMAERVRSAADQLLFVPLSAELDRFATARAELRVLRGGSRRKAL